MRKLTTKEFIDRCIKVHGDKYDYSLLEYENMKSKVKIIYDGWIFEQKAEDHFLGKLCELRWDTDRFIFESKKVHGDKYDYSKSIYKNSKTNIIIILGSIEYLQNPCKHLMGRCPERGEKLRTNEEFIEKAREVWGYKYDYSLVDYKGSYIDIKIKYKGKIFEQKPTQHLSGYKCECSNIKNTEDFIEKAIKKWGYKYDYSLVDYKGINKKVKIKYNNIIYEQKAGGHLYSNGSVENITIRKTTKEFILESNIVHDDKYNYDKSIYVNNITKIIITCPIHGDFTQRPSAHLSGAGCNNCKESRGEKIISKYLNKKNILYYRQYKFPNCENIRKLPFDFYIPSIRTAIEFDGEQHFQPMEFFGGLKAYEKLKINDKIKDDYCENNYINLIRIKYDQINYINDILLSNLKSKS